MLLTGDLLRWTNGRVGARKHLNSQVHLKCGASFLGPLKDEHSGGFSEAKQTQRDQKRTIIIISTMHGRYNHAKEVRLAGTDPTRHRWGDTEVTWCPEEVVFMHFFKFVAAISHQTFILIVIFCSATGRCTRHTDLHFETACSGCVG